MPFVSVIIPVYNVEKYLKMCVDSVLAQTFKDYEIILVDDESTDSSAQICDEYAEKYPFISVIHQKNKGLGGARNTGIYEAKGDYLLFLDSDDKIHPELLGICEDKIKKYGCDMVFYDLVDTYEDGTLGDKYSNSYLKANTVLSGELLKPLACTTGACNRIFKKSLFLNNGIEFPEKVWYEDLRIVEKFTPFVNTAYYCNEKPLYYYLQRTGSIMHTPNYKRIVTERIAAVNEIWDYYAENEFLTVYKTEIEFLMIYHGFLSPIREIQSTTFNFGQYADTLRCNLDTHFKNVFENKYISALSRKEKMLLKWAYNGNYGTIKIFSLANKLIKRVRNVK